MDQSQVQWGHTVVLRFLDDRLSSLDVIPGKTFRFGRRPNKVDGLVGLTFGKSYEILKDGAHFVEADLPDSESVLAEDAGDGTNQFIVDDNQSQKLTSEDIKKMREEGASGNQIIQALVENSASFQSRTEFSREKYIRRKQKKYLNMVTVLRPTVQLIQQVYFLKNPSRIMSLREDAFAHMLSLANVHAYSRALVFDNCMGLVTAAVAERLGGFGEILAPHDGKHPRADIALMLNFPAAIIDTIKHFPLQLVTTMSEPQSTPVSIETRPAVPSTDEVQPQVHEQAQEQAQERVQTQIQSGDAESSTGRPKRKHAQLSAEVQELMEQHRRTHRFPRATEASIRDSLTRGCDSLIIATPHDPSECLALLLPFLRGSGSFVVFCPFVQPLAEAMLSLAQTGLATKLELFETWLRHYQVLPNRTHPEMVTHAASGFVLSGIKVFHADRCPPLPKAT